MTNIIIYGVRESGQKLLWEYDSPPLNRTFHVVCLADSNPALWGTEIYGKKVISPNEIAQYDYDKIIIGSYSGHDEIYQFLQNSLNIPEHAIDRSEILSFDRARQVFVAYAARILKESGNIGGCVAEAGVFRGDFAKYINAYFPDSTLYLFDTFTGHDKEDIMQDQKKKITSLVSAERYAQTSVELVKSVLPHPEKAIFRIGYFPDTAAGITDEFLFVSIDMNLYMPTLAALEFFYPRMVVGGIILCHDYFSWEVEPGVHIAINEFCSKNRLSFMPIGDRMSIALVKI